MKSDTDRSATNNGGPAAGTLSDRVRSLRLTEGAAKKGARGGFFPWALAVVLALTTVVFGVKAFRAPGVADAPGSPSADNRNAESPGASSSPAASSGEVALESRGYVIAAHSIQLSPQVGGEIVELDPNFREGAVYKRGAFLAQIDPVIYQAQVNSAKAALSVAKTNNQQVENGSTLKEIEAARATLKNLASKLEMAQLDERYNRAAGLGTSRSDLDRSIIQVKMDQAAHDAQKQALDKLELLQKEQVLITRAQVQSAEANVQQAEKQLKNCTIVAPTTGIILSKKAELHGYVNPLAFGAAGYLCEIADLTDLEVDLSIQERDIHKVFPGQECTLRPEAFSNSEQFKKKHPDGYRGTVSRLMPVADRSKGAISVRVAIDRREIPEDEAGIFLRPDMSALVWFKKAK